MKHKRKKKVVIPAPSTVHKLGANHGEFAKRPRPRDPNFSQSRDIREDRGERQAKEARVKNGT
jgi:hypothetical protein